MCAKNHLLIFSSFLDIWENVEWPRFLDHPVNLTISERAFSLSSGAPFHYPLETARAAQHSVRSDALHLARLIPIYSSLFADILAMGGQLDGLLPFLVAILQFYYCYLFEFVCLLWLNKLSFSPSPFISTFKCRLTGGVARNLLRGDNRGSLGSPSGVQGQSPGEGYDGGHAPCPPLATPLYPKIIFLSLLRPLTSAT